MKRITFIRHAKSDWSNPEFADYQRPLNARGRRDAPEMGRRLATRNDPPQLILLSTSDRTKETMALLKETAGWTGINTAEKDWLYLASAQEYIKSIEKLHDELDHVCFCGHNPTITSVINHFTGEDIDSVPTCGIAVVEFDVDSWRNTSADSGRMVYLDYPKNKK